jgi:hypothetical protein
VPDLMDAGAWCGCDTAAVIGFRFELRPLDEVEPWGDDPPSLSWFGLTDGWYWIEAGGHELLRRRLSPGTTSGSHVVALAGPGRCGAAVRSHAGVLVCS